MVEVEVEAKEVPPEKAGFFLCNNFFHYKIYFAPQITSVKDLFSSYAHDYARYRPRYPEDMFAHIYKQLTSFNLAWDCGTGNGQSAVELAKHFKQVYATDISLEQLQQAMPAINVTYAKEPAEHTTLADNSVDLITVSQALHWFDFSAFYTEVNRVASADAIIAAWTYNLLQVDEKIDPLIKEFYFKTLGNYWDAERDYVDRGYANLPFPYTDSANRDFYIEITWSLKEMAGYISTWSGLRKFITRNNLNPLDELIGNIQKYWPGNESKKIRFPLHIKTGKVSTFDKQLIN